MLIKFGGEEGEALLRGLLAPSKVPSLVHFVRGLVGMDRAGAQAAFSKLLSNQSLAPSQIRFVEMNLRQIRRRTKSLNVDSPLFNMREIVFASKRKGPPGRKPGSNQPNAASTVVF